MKEPRDGTKVKSCSRHLLFVADSFLNVEDEEMIKSLERWLGTLLERLIYRDAYCKDVGRLNWKEALRPVPWRAVCEILEVVWAESAFFRGGVCRVKLDHWISLRLFSNGPPDDLALLRRIIYTCRVRSPLFFSSSPHYVAC